MQFYPAAGAPHPTDFANHKLVLPGESIGNVGQLAADLLIATRGMPLIGYLESPLVQPCTGRNAYARTGTLHLALELYADADNGLAILQQRAPVLRGCQAQFAAQLADWLQASAFSQIIYLGSLDARVRTDAQMGGSQLRFIAADDSMRQLGNGLAISELEESLVEAAAGKRLLPPWPLIAAAEERAPPLLTVVTFATEGDNVTDAERLADAVGRHLMGGAGDGAVAISWQQPLSWQSVYGARDMAAY